MQKVIPDVSSWKANKIEETSWDAYDKKKGDYRRSFELEHSKERRIEVYGEICLDENG